MEVLGDLPKGFQAASGCWIRVSEAAEWRVGPTQLDWEPTFSRPKPVFNSQLRAKIFC